MQADPILFAVFLIFTGAAVLAALALFARQSLLIAYIALGGLCGPAGFNLVAEPRVIEQIGHVGIIFLLYLLGLNLHPQKLLTMLREATRVTAISSAAFAAVAAIIVWGFGYTFAEGIVIGAVMMFSSTIIGLKLLPTTALHQRHMGEVMISVLLLQDILAIFILLLLQGAGQDGGTDWLALGQRLLALPLLFGLALLLERKLLMPLIARFDVIQEYVFLTAVGWCLGMAQLAHALGLSYEIGAFVAGVALATSIIATFIAESLKPLRDFFVIMFFFSVGASFELGALGSVLLPALVLAAAMLWVKPRVFTRLLLAGGEKPRLAYEIGVRLGQVSEFSLLIAVLATQAGVIGTRASSLIQAATLLTFIASSYWVVRRFPTPMAVNDRLRRD
ncbi:cation:proton antiporter [Plasticicumulans sp.]|uniref:cation:proton antiporter domain-containing protein n=1 Tax=Plasticicumulans sp. TaxID=2307179 RepID=UPI000FA047BA|nr:cation:proton antiporter [Plasticicumulans sp.]MBS0600782.1 cation:proton antiporter [Pseudomonadota bacterium]RTL05645.1 MAG: cation:proton antiporter [Xanthomonadales bacterium]HMV39930.1 cation:proton antiporter [Plasticicumulans sp.]HMW31294.1 cation:proton antiporter [Plasticicumulans sp.]HMW43642.1 cation:proton antiporter [Plasticicumulans sp.]